MARWLLEPVTPAAEAAATMGVKGKNPHNALAIDTFGQVEHAAGLLSALLPREVMRHLDMATLELTQDHLVDEKLRETETDLLYRVATLDGDEVVVYVLLEHQSSSDGSMVFRLLRYMVRIWDRWRRSNEEARRLPPIIPVVLSHAPGGWTAPRTFLELVDGPAELIGALRPHLPDFEPVLEDLSNRSDAEVEAMTMTALSRLVVMLLKHVRDGDIVERLPGWADAFRAAFEGSGIDALYRVLVYIFECVDEVSLDDLRWIDGAVETPEGGVAMNLAERLRQEGRKEGRKEGQKEGQKEGRKAEKGEVARRALAAGLALEEVAKLVDLPVEQVRRLTQ